MSQQEFEPQRHETGAGGYRSQDPYNWPKQQHKRNEGAPRDEPPGDYSRFGHEPGQQEHTRQTTSFPKNRSGNGRAQIRPTSQVPWWAQPQTQPQVRRRGSPRLVGLIVIAVLMLFILGGLGIGGIIFGFIGQIMLGLLGTLLAFLVIFVLIILCAFALLWWVIRYMLRSSARVRRQQTRRSHW